MFLHDADAILALGHGLGARPSDRRGESKRWPLGSEAKRFFGSGLCGRDFILAIAGRPPLCRRMILACQVLYNFRNGRSLALGMRADGADFPAAGRPPAEHGHALPSIMFSLNSRVASEMAQWLLFVGTLR